MNDEFIDIKLTKLNTDGPPYNFAIRVPRLMLTFQLTGCCEDCDKATLGVADELIAIINENLWRLKLSAKDKKELEHG